MIKLKDNSIDLSNLNPALNIALYTLDKIIEQYTPFTVITCGREGKHSYTSLHYSGNAVDIRSRGLTKEQQLEVKKEFDKAMNIDYDFVIEDDHFHLEYQPKRK